MYFYFITFLKKKLYFLLFTIRFNLEKYSTFLLCLMHIKYGKRKLKRACLPWEPMIIVFMHQAHSSTSVMTFIK